MRRDWVSALLPLALCAVFGSASLLLAGWLALAFLDLARAHSVALWAADHAPDLVSKPEQFAHDAINSLQTVGIVAGFLAMMALGALRAARTALAPGERRLRRLSTHSRITGGSYVVLGGLTSFVLGYGVTRPLPYLLAALAIVGVLAWRETYARYRAGRDVPTSSAGSAAPGYVELMGRAAALPDTPLTAPHSGTPCCWYSYTVEEWRPGQKRDDDGRWVEVAAGESADRFLLVDGTGQCEIAPAGADIFEPQQKKWTDGSKRYTEELILPGDPVYSLGQLRVIDGDARVLGQPSDGRPFVVASERSESVGSFLLGWTAIHLSIFIGAGAGAILLALGVIG